MSNPTFINFLGQGDRLPTVMNYFRKGSIYANEDPLYLTFFLDFNPSVGDPHPETIAFNSLLMDMEPTAAREVNLANSPTGFELSTLEYLQRAYNQTYVSAKDGPAGNLRKFQTILNNMYQETPWYFQSVSGISDLWKKSMEVGDVGKKVTLTVTCNESVDMRLIQMADFYRNAIYDKRARAYRVPDNLRKFSFDLYLFEIRDLKVFQNSTRKRETSIFTNGNHFIKFKCKMCEFDFSDILQGGQNAVDSKSFIEDRPFTTQFKINIDWVSEDSSYQEIEAVLKDVSSPIASRLGDSAIGSNEANFGILSGAVQSATSQVTRQLTNISRVPSRIIGAILNEIQTTIEGKVLGNVYDGRYGPIISTSGLVNDIGQVYTPPRRSPVGPPTPQDLGTAGGYG
jgi:hypothetical protein